MADENIDEKLDELDGVETPSPPSGAKQRVFDNSRAALAGESLRRVLGADIRRRIKTGAIRTITLIAPTAQWLAPLEKATAALLGHARVATYTGTKPRKYDATTDDLATYLSLGRLVVVIGTAIEHLPPPVVATADLALTIKSPDVDVLKAVARRCMRGRPADALDGMPPLAGLDFDDVTACLPSGAPVSVAAAKLRKAIASKLPLARSNQNLPTLESAAGYGAALNWGLDLKRDVEDLRTGKIGWADVDRGAVLYGPPGTGKSIFAHILGNACGLPTISTSVADLFATSAGYLDSVIKAMRTIFEQARSMAPCLLFLDELDALPNRATLSPRGRDWWTPIVTDFLVQLDSAVAHREGIIVVGATNRLDDIDLAICRPGRLERLILVGPPEPADLEKILRHYLGDELLDADLMPIIYARPGSTGAEAMEWARGARRRARRAGRAMTLEDLRAHVLPASDQSIDDLQRTAIHEAGHACADLLLGRGSVERVVLASSAQSLGHTVFRTPGGSFAKAELERMVIVLLAGRAAEIAFYSAAWTGAGGQDYSDLARATIIVASWHASFGLGDSLIWRAKPDAVTALLATDDALRAAVDADLQRLQTQAIEMIGRHRDEVEAVADALVERRVLLRGDIVRILENVGPLPDDRQSARSSTRP